MLNTDNINYIEISLLETQVDLVLDALQLYAFNFHRVWPVDRNSDLEELRNSMIFHTYEQIQAKYKDNRYTHNDYNVKDTCRLVSRRNRIKKYKLLKKVS